MSWYQQAQPIIKSPYTSSFNPSKFKPATAQKSTYTAPKTVTQATMPQAQAVTQPQGYAGYEPQGYQPAWNMQMPGLPQEPVVTQDLIAQWQARAKQEASMVYDPQVLAIQQELDKAILAASQSAGNIPGYYDEILSQIKQWQADETKAMQQRYYARGMGTGGGLIQEENKLAETALKQTTNATTEKARKLGDIDAQKQQLIEQAGAKTTGAETAEGQYMASRSAELQDSYVQQKQALEQQKFQNQMAIQQFGLTAETQAFNQWLSSMEASADIWYNNQQLALEEESARLASAAKSGSSKSNTLTTGRSNVVGLYESTKDAAKRIATRTQAPNIYDNAWNKSQYESI